jgi:hypothetical protein
LDVHDHGNHTHIHTHKHTHTYKYTHTHTHSQPHTLTLTHTHTHLRTAFKTLHLVHDLAGHWPRLPPLYHFCHHTCILNLHPVHDFAGRRPRLFSSLGRFGLLLRSIFPLALWGLSLKVGNRREALLTIVAYLAGASCVL